jgi:hypothetical protein
VAYQDCVHANSGLTAWLKKPRTAPTREAVKWVPTRKPTLKRSLFIPRRQSEPDRKRSVDMISGPIHLLERGSFERSRQISLPDVNIERYLLYAYHDLMLYNRLETQSVFRQLIQDNRKREIIEQVVYYLL